MRMLTCMMVLAILITINVFPAETVDPSLQKGKLISDQDLIFKAKVIKIAPPVPASGVFTFYRLAKYRVEKVCRGHYPDAEIVVDHFSHTSEELDGIKVGDRVFVAAYKRKRINPRTDVEGIRSSTDKVEFFYIGGGVAPPKESPGDCVEEAVLGFKFNHYWLK